MLLRNLIQHESWIGAILGGALASLSLRLPIVPALVLGWIAGLSCNRAFGGRAAHGTLGRAFAVVLVGVTVGYAGYLTGGWGMERMLASRVEQTRADLDNGVVLVSHEVDGIAHQVDQHLHHLAVEVLGEQGKLVRAALGQQLGRDLEALALELALLLVQPEEELARGAGRAA